MHLAFLTTLALASCTHGEPFSPGEPHNEGPRTQALPRQLTFSPFDDAAPVVAGNEIVYSQAPIGDDPRARCLAVLPVEGGQALRVACPPATVDTFLATWDEPAVSPAGDRIAFLWVRSPRFSALGAWTHELAIAPTGAPATPDRRLSLGGFLPDGRRANTATQLAWIGETTVRYVAAADSIWKVKGGGALRTTDTAVNPVALMDLDVAAGTITPVPGGDTVQAWTPASDGGFWLGLPGAVGLWRVDAAGARTHVGDFSGSPLTLVEVPGGVVAGFMDGRVERLDPSDGSRTSIPVPGDGPIRRLAWHAATGRLVVAAEPALSGFGTSADLWLVEIR